MVTLRTENVSKTYSGAVPTEALVGVNLEIKQGDYVAIEGPSGSGKSTLLNILALLDTPTRGAYLIDDESTSDLPDAQRAHLRSTTFAFVFQAFHLLDGRTVAENVALGALYQGLPASERHHRAERSLERVGLGTLALKPVETLSGGEKQRVAIARAMTAQTPVLVADEPTGNLDSKNSVLVMDALSQFNSDGRTVIVVTHDPLVAARAKRRLNVLDGRVAEVGSATASSNPAHPQQLPEGRAVRHGRRDTINGARGQTKIRLRDVLEDAWVGLRSKPARTIGLILAVALGVALTLTTAGIATTASDQVSALFDSQRNRQVRLTSPAMQPESPSDRALAESLTAPESAVKLEAIAGVDNATLLATYADVPVSSGLKVPGTDSIQAELIGLVGDELPAGSYEVDYLGSHGPLAEEEVLIGANLAAQIQLGPLLAAPTIWVDDSPLQVAGIITGAGLRVGTLSSIVRSNDALIPYHTPRYVTAELRVLPGSAQQVAIQAPIAWLPTAPDLISADAPPDPSRMREQIEGNVATMLAVLAAIALVAAALSLAISMTSAVRTRTGEFGLRRAMGATRKQVISLVLTESVAIGIIGGVLGSYAAVLAILGVTIARHWQPVLDPLLIPAGIVGGVLVGLLGGVLATRRASRIEPSDALRA